MSEKTIRRTAAIIVASMAFAAPVCAADAAFEADSAKLAIIPAPQKVVRAKGECRTKDAPKFEKVASIPPEGYEISITTDGVTVRSSDDAGAFYAKMTLEQLRSKGTMTLPCVEIKDSPAFKWRGLMLDESRHFLGKEAVKRTLDLMAQFKLNVFHWHLVDDQGWRLEIKSHPELVEYGAARPASVAFAECHFRKKGGGYGYNLNTERYGPFFYTQDDVREILAYAVERHITVVPEIEVPGHVRALLAARPDLGCQGDGLERVPRIIWGVETDVLCAGNDGAVKYLEEIYDEVCALFPSEYIHIGGDECPKTRWKACPKCQARKKALGLSDERGLQAWLTTHFAEYLAKKGRRAVGWDEALSGDVPKSLVGMNWRWNGKGASKDKGCMSAAEAAECGFDLVMTPSWYCYYSRPQGVPDDPYPYYSPKSRLTLEKAYSFDPLASVPESARGRVLGGQASVWTEFVWNRYDFEWKLWPRGLAMAEVLWTYPDPKKRDFAEFSKRAAEHRRRLIREHVNCAPLK